MRAQPRAVATRVLALALVLGAGTRARAEDKPQPPPVEVRVQNRFVEKAKRFEMAIGFAYLERDDFYRNPGGQFTLTYWLRESLALEAQLAGYDSVETFEARQVREQTGFLPDIRRERPAQRQGGRWSFGYGKVLLGRRVIHFDPQIFLHAGAHVTDDGGIWPLFDGGLALATRPLARMLVRLDLGLVLEGEQRSAGYVAVFGFQPVLAVGFLL